MLVVLGLSLWVEAAADGHQAASYHIGFLYPNGVDVAGYSVEKQLENHFYRFHTFGYPSFAALGVSYYQRYQDSGFVATFGVGVGSIMYTSAAYQWQLGMQDYLKLGAGFATGVAYTGSYPVLSYEHRFRPGKEIE